MELHWLLPVVLITAKLLGGAARRCGFPAVVGEITAGIVLGPSLLGLVELPAHGETTSPLLALAQIGLCALLFRIGLETDLENARRMIGRAAALGMVGMLLPLLLGALAAAALGVSLLPALFVGATLTATSIGVTAAVLEELEASASRAATLILGAAVVDDVLGLILLAALIGVSSANGAVGLALAVAVGQAVLFLVVALSLGRPLTEATLRLTRWTRSQGTLFALVFSALLLTAWVAKLVGLEFIIGAYAAGLALARHPEREWLRSEFRPVVELFTPVFFVLVGSAIAIDSFSTTSASGRLTLSLAGVLFVAAVAGKLFAPMAIPKLGAPPLAVGSALVPRGEVGLVFAQVGLGEGVLSPDLFAALALVIIATTLVGPLLLRRFWPTDPPLVA